MATRQVGGNVTIWLLPERMIIGQWLGISHVQPGGGQATGVQGIAKRPLVHGGAPSDIVKDRPRLHMGKTTFIKEKPRFGTVGENVDDMVRLLRHGFRKRCFGNHRHPLVSPGPASIRQNVHVQRSQHFHQPFGYGSIPEDQHRLPCQRDRGPAHLMPERRAIGGPGLQSQRQISCLGEQEAEDMGGTCLLIHRRAVGHWYSTGFHLGAKLRRVITGNSRGTHVNPFQMLRFINRREIGLAEGNVGGHKLRIALRLGQH